MKINKNKILIFTVALLSFLGFGLMLFNKPEPYTKPAPYQKNVLEESQPNKDSKETQEDVSKKVPEVGDERYSQMMRELETTYTWFHKIPIETEEYRIVYDLQRESFRIRLKISRNSPQETIENLTNKALEEIKNIGVEDPIPHYVVYID